MKTVMRNPSSFMSERGSVFFYILLGVVLFAGLAFVVTRSMKGTGGHVQSLTDRQADILASEIIAYAQSVEWAVSKVLSRGFSENQISFYSPKASTTFTGSRYANSNCTEDACLVFHPDGGGILWQEPPKGAADYSWHFTRNHRIPGYGGTGHAGVVLHLVGVGRTLCEKINEKSGYNFSSIPIEARTSDATAYTGSFASGKYISCNSSLCADKIGMCLQYSPSYSSALGEQYVFYYGVYVLPD